MKKINTEFDKKLCCNKDNIKAQKVIFKADYNYKNKHHIIFQNIISGLISSLQPSLSRLITFYYSY